MLTLLNDTLYIQPLLFSIALLNSLIKPSAVLLQENFAARA